jgi:hypothetical protein
MADAPKYNELLSRKLVFKYLPYVYSKISASAYKTKNENIAPLNNV